MKTTIELPDELVAEVKIEAAPTGTEILADDRNRLERR